MLHNVSVRDQYDQLVCSAVHLAVEQRHQRVNYAFKGHPLPATEMQTKDQRRETDNKQETRWKRTTENVAWHVTHTLDR